MKLLLSSILSAVTLQVNAATESPAGAMAYIISPANGDVVSSPFTVRFGLKGMGVAPAGVDKANTGHHHLLVDTKLSDYKNAIPKDKQHKHFGGGQTEASIDLPPGKHTLQLVLGDKSHMPHSIPVESETITIIVK
ncbi:MAG: DUF4399 domain-containing protein [Gammaproteobacteria bacterium]|nr:DUF4399 domain-containing protein [Gammaproteobacteria bacterium]